MALHFSPVEISFVPSKARHIPKKVNTGQSIIINDTVNDLKNLLVFLFINYPSAYKLSPTPNILPNNSAVYLASLTVFTEEPTSIKRDPVDKC